MERGDGWRYLVESLDAWTRAVEIAPGQIEVSVRQGGASRQVMIVMTPHEWDDMAGVMWGNVDDALDDIKRTLLAMGPEQDFAVYSDYRLEPSPTAVLTEPPEVAPHTGGEWVAYDRDGRIAGRFADSSEPDAQS